MLFRVSMCEETYTRSAPSAVRIENTYPEIADPVIDYLLALHDFPPVAVGAIHLSDKPSTGLSVQCS